MGLLTAIYGIRWRENGKRGERNRERERGGGHLDRRAYGGGQEVYLSVVELRKEDHGRVDVNAHPPSPLRNPTRR